MSKNKKVDISPTTTSFWNSLEKALKRYDDSAWLGQNSPLATPYFLGLSSTSTKLTKAERGRALRELFQSATKTIAGKDAERYQSILTEYYFQSRSVGYMLDHLALGRDAFHTHRKRAITALEQAIIELLRPSLRLEMRPVSGPFFGYTEEIKACQQALQNRNNVAITGNVGSGKTMFGSFVIQSYLHTDIFWYTVQPSLNDHYNTLLFALGYFFHIHGSSALWLQLVADGDKIQQKLIPGLINFTVTQCEGNLPILCFDQIDRLQPTENGEHAAIVGLLNSLKGLMPLLFMGQQIPVKTDLAYSLTNISLGATREWFEFKEISLSFSELEQIYTNTNGNPRLIELFISLAASQQQKEEIQIEDILSALSHNLSVDFMLRHIMSQISETERKILMELSVYRRPAPADVWVNTREGSFAVSKILQWHLVRDDQKGGIALLSVYRAAIYQSLSPETRELLHDKAANIRAERGAYTAAVYHLIHANAVEEAILLWYEHRQQEIEQGHGQTAYTMLHNLSSTRVNQTSKEYLYKTQCELALLFGDHANAHRMLEAIEWKNNIMQVFSAEQKAHIAKAESRFEAAQLGYQRALQKAEEIIENRLVYIHKDIARVHMHERNLEKAWYEVQLAQYEAKNIQGDLRRRQGGLGEAIEHYLDAYTLAEKLNYKMGQAKTANNLSLIYKRQGALHLAKFYMEQAVEHYERMGKITAIAGMKINIAAYYNHTGEYDLALETGQEACKIFARLLNERGQAMANQNLSESHLALDNLDQAEACSRAVIESEEITLLPDAYRVFGEIAAQRGAFSTAEKFINDSIQLSQSNEDIWLEAYAHRALGKVYQLQRKSGQADTAFDRAIEFFEELKLDNEVAATAALRVHSTSRR